MENLTHPTQKSHRAALVIAFALLVVVILGLMTACYFQLARANDLQHKVDDLTAALTKKETEKAGENPAASVEYREIPELGVKYKLTDETKYLTYSFRSNEDGAIRTAGFSTVAISAMKGTGIEEFPCTSSLAPSGSFTLYKNGYEVVQGGRMVKDIARKVGSYYYVYAHPQYACSLSPNSLPSVEGLQASIDAVKAAFDSLEAI